MGIQENRGGRRRTGGGRGKGGRWDKGGEQDKQGKITQQCFIFRNRYWIKRRKPQVARGKLFCKVSCFLLKSFHFRSLQQRQVFSHTNPYISNVTQQSRCSPMLIFRAWATCEKAEEKMEEAGNVKHGEQKVWIPLSPPKRFFMPNNQREYENFSTIYRALSK